MIVRGNPGWTNELPDRFKDLFEDETPEVAKGIELPPLEDVPPEHVEFIREDSFHKELFAKLNDDELKSARKLCPFYRILRFFKKSETAAGG